MTPELSEAEKELMAEFEIGYNSDNVPNPFTGKKWITDFLLTAYRKGCERGREEYTTKFNVEDKDELYCVFWRCLSCNNGSIPEGSKFCSDCGRKLIGK